jgi:hypothetical protein
MTRPTRYASRTPSPAAETMAFQAPPPDLDLTPAPGSAGASQAAPEAPDRPDDERGRLLARITTGRVPSRALFTLKAGIPTNGRARESVASKRLIDQADDTHKLSFA